MTDSTNNKIANEAMQAAFGAVFAAAGQSLDYYATTVDTLLEESTQHEAWKTWIVGLSFITLCSFSAPIGILILPCLARWLYEKIMCFLIALGIGTLTGSCFFIMIPQAFGLAESGIDYIGKAAIMVASLYGFFAIDRILQYILEIRRRRVRQLGLFHNSSLNIKKEQSRREEKIENVTDDVRKVQETRYGSCNGLHRGNVLHITVQNSILARTSDFTTVVISSDGASETIEDQPEGRNNSTDMLTVARASAQKEDDEVSISVQVLEQRVVDQEDLEIASIAYVIILGSSLNNFFDGMSMGAIFASSLPKGVLIGISSFSQQFPQEVGTLAILADSGLGIRRTLLVNLIPAFLSYLGFAIGVILDIMGEGYKSYVFSISAGMYLYVFLGTLIPEVRGATEQLIKTDLRESLLVTFLQFLGIGGGVTFMYCMKRF